MQLHHVDLSAQVLDTLVALLTLTALLFLPLSSHPILVEFALLLSHVRLRDVGVNTPEAPFNGCRRDSRPKG
jgi:hypothetical protein